jgi:flagellar motor component MotA
MSVTRPLGIVAGAGCVLVSAAILMHLMMLFDATSMLLSVLSTLLLLMYTYGIHDLRRYLLGGWMRMLRPDHDTPWYDTDHAKAARIATSAIFYALMSGMAGTLIGNVQMLLNMTDPSALGPAVALSLLTFLYGVGLTVVVFLPLVRFHTGEARGLAEKDRDETLFHTLGAATFALLACFGSFFVMLVAMSDFGSGS